MHVRPPEVVMLLLALAAAQAMTAQITIHVEGEAAARLTASDGPTPDAPAAWRTRDGRDWQMIATLSPIDDDSAWVAVSVRERARDGWRLVTRPLLQIDQGRPGRLAIGTQRVISASEGDARWVTTRAVELHVELLPDAPAAGPRVLHLATFAEPDAEAFGVPVAGGLRCPAELVVVDGDRGAVVAPPQREGTWSCELLRPGAPPEPITIDLRVW